MKQVFYKGLLALTIAFGVTSCDKNDVGELNEPMAAVKGITSKVSFGESTGIKVKNEAGKTASEFDHIYSTVDQSIVIMDSNEAIVFSGSYAAGDIASGISPDSGFAVPIILQNGSYSVATTNGGGEGIGYLPYSSSANFDLDSSTETILLDVTHTHGFVIINVEDALENGRVTGATASLGGENPVSLLTDVEFGDFYGYLVGGMNYDITANYDLNGVSTPRSELDKRIAIGLAYTFELGLTADIPVSTRTVTATVFGQEATIGELGDGRDINGDGDLLDGLSRESSTIYTTTAGTEVAGDPTLGAWSVISDINVDVSVATATVTSTEAAESLNVNSDTDMYDTIQKIVTTTTTSTTDLADVSNSVDGEWTIVRDYSSAGFGETPGTDDGDVADEADEYISSAADAIITGGVSSSNDPAFGAWVVVEAPVTQAITSRSRSRVVRTDITARISTVVTSYTVQINVREDVPALAAKSDTSAVSTLADSSFSEETETETEDNFANPDYVTPNGVDTWDVTGTYGGEDVLGALTYNDAPSDTSVATYTKIGTQAYSVNAAGNVETYNVVDAQDGDIVDGTTRNVETAAAQSGLSREASREENVVNPNYDAPDVTPSSFDVAVNLGNSPVFASLLFDGSFASVDFTPVTSGNPAIGFSQSFEVASAGTYFFYTWATNTHFTVDTAGTTFNQAVGHRIVVAADGSVTVTDL